MKSIKTQFSRFQFFYPYTVALVAVRVGNQVNVMSCAWHTALSVDPPLFGVLIARSRLSHRLITEAREFTVNFIGFEQVKLSAQMGRRSGADLDKVKEFGVKLQPAQFIQTPILADSYVAFECRLVEVRAFGDHDLFAGEVVAVREEPRSFNGEGLLNTVKVRPLLYLGSDFYITVDPDSLKHVALD
jgi:flavin reductase (DIM6/NTAB) family NADH-FMN oxidoreductase RutF